MLERSVRWRAPPSAKADASGSAGAPAVAIRQKPGACRKGTTAQVPEKVATPPSTVRRECDTPPITGSFITSHCSADAPPPSAAPPKLASSTEPSSAGATVAPDGGPSAVTTTVEAAWEGGAALAAVPSASSCIASTASAAASADSTAATACSVSSNGPSRKCGLGSPRMSTSARLSPTDWIAEGRSVAPCTERPIRLAVNEASGRTNEWTPRPRLAGGRSTCQTGSQTLDEVWTVNLKSSPLPSTATRKPAVASLSPSDCSVVAHDAKPPSRVEMLPKKRRPPVGVTSSADDEWPPITGSSTWYQERLRPLSERACSVCVFMSAMYSIPCSSLIAKGTA